MLVTALEIDGHYVDEAGNARDGLLRLQQGRYNLVLTDYAMPGGTGTWMLNEAAGAGLLDRTVAMIVTAHPDVGEFTDIEVITKPIDLDHFLEQVRRILVAPDARDDSPKPAFRTDGGENHRAELVLYVSSESAASLQARRNLERLLERFDMSQIEVTICDLTRDPLAGEDDRVAFTPTLVKRHPEPRMWVLGSLRESDLVVDMLRVAGVDVKE